MYSNVKLKFSDFLPFLFIFTIFNDTFTTEVLGENSLKLVFLIFIIFNINRFIYNAFNKVRLLDILLYLFIFLFSLVFILNELFNNHDNVLNRSLRVISLALVPIFFKGYPLYKTLYFLWLSMIFSIIICFFNEPVSEWTFRKSGGVGDPNEFGAQLLIFIFLSTFLYSENKNNIFLGISITFFTYAMLVSASKAAILVGSMAFAILSLRYMFLGNSRGVYGLAFISAIGFTITLTFNFEILDLVSDRFASNTSADQRFESWRAGFRAVEDNIFLGHGVELYASTIIDEFGFYGTRSTGAAHNVFLQILVESGIFPFIAFTFFLFILITHKFLFIFKSRFFFIWIAVFSTVLMGLSLGLLYKKFFILMLSLLMNFHSNINSLKMQ